MRIAWADHCLALYQNHPELAKQINGICYLQQCLIIHWSEIYLLLFIQDAIRSKMSDPDEKVRIAFCKIFSQIDYESALKLVDKELLEVLGSRCRDRKVRLADKELQSSIWAYSGSHIF